MENNKPVIEEVSIIKDNILMLRVQDGKIKGGVQIPYEPQEGETLQQDDVIPSLVYIVKDGKRIGIKVEDRQLGTQRFPYEEVTGERLDKELADSEESYLVNGVHPVSVFRKTKPDNFADPYQGYTYLHCIYLVCSRSFVNGEKITIEIRKGIFDSDLISLLFNDCLQFSEAVHVTQVGYRDDDPSKKAYLSQWMGLGGSPDYSGVKDFYLLNEKNEKVYHGKVICQHDGTPVMAGYGRVGTLAPVYEMDFSDFNQQGTYRVMVPGIGCSMKFVVGDENVWADFFKANMNALYCQRSGIKTGKPYTEFERPRCYHPDDGQIVYQSNCSLFESGNGMNCYGTDTNNFGNLVRKATDQVVENAWGGYFDACDWDRRIQHLKASNLQMELYLMFPEFYENLKLNIPESGNGIPDIINEALYNTDFYKRLQLPDGGIRGGIEQEEHPVWGQAGWQDAWKAYAYAPDFWSSYYYAGSAARMAYILNKYNKQLADEYRASAVKAFEYAERTYREAYDREWHKWTQRARQGVVIQRQNAAVELLRLTGEEKYDHLYRELKDDHNYDALFAYSILPEGAGDENLKNGCRKLIIASAEKSLESGNKLPFHLVSEDIRSQRVSGWGSFYTVAKTSELIRAHYLTDDIRFLKAALAAEDFSMGANPDNMCFTTGVGERYPMNILHHDSRLTGQPAPVGITVMGPQDFNYPDDAFPRLIRDDFMWPGAYSWPPAEGYLDIYRHPCVCEYTVQGSIGPKSYRSGYFAARKRH